jgi:hypothetical protein
MTTMCVGGFEVGAACGRAAALDPARAQVDRSSDEITSTTLEGRTDIDPG